jgi:hypothetical protein
MGQKPKRPGDFDPFAQHFEEGRDSWLRRIARQRKPPQKERKQ